jgi:putative endonuclease
VPPRDTRRRLGNFGESVAAAYLRRAGYTVLARQWRCATGEIDLVAQQGEQLVFVEVRTRRGTTHGSAEESVTTAKQARLIALAYEYLAAFPADGEPPWRIDVIALTIDGAGRVRHLNHIPHAVEG